MGRTTGTGLSADRDGRARSVTVLTGSLQRQLTDPDHPAVLRRELKLLAGYLFAPLTI